MFLHFVTDVTHAIHVHKYFAAHGGVVQVVTSCVTTVTQAEDKSLRQIAPRCHGLESIIDLLRLVDDLQVSIPNVQFQSSTT